MPTFADLEAASLVQTKLNNAILRTDAVVVVATTSQLADLTYTTGNAWTVASGTKVYVLMGNYSYEVQASGAATYDLEVDGVRLNVLPNEANEYPFDAMLPAKNGTTDDLPKLNTLIVNKSFVSNAGAGQRMGPTIRFGYGRYYFNGTISPKAQVRLIGQYTGYGNERSTDFLFPAATAGIIINRFSSEGVVDSIADPYGADGSQIIGIKLTGGRGASFNETQSGIWLRARGLIQDCACINFAGHGIFAAAGSDGNPYQGNCNLFTVKHVYLETNRGNGIHLEGTDANAGWVEQVNAKSNDGWGVFEDSFLQNYHAGHHAIDNDLGAYYAANGSALYSSYVEDGNGSNLAWGGPLHSLIAGNVDFANGPYLSPAITNGPKGYSNRTGGFRGAHEFGTTDIATENYSVLSARHSSLGISVPFRILWAEDGTRVFVRWASSATNLLNFNGPSTGAGYGRTGAIGESLNIPSLFLGLNASARNLSYGSATPTSGEYARGDVIYLNTATSGGVGQVQCTTAGIAGSTAVFRNAANLASS